MNEVFAEWNDSLILSLMGRACLPDVFRGDPPSGTWTKLGRGRVTRERPSGVLQTVIRGGVLRSYAFR
jgi:hypothetical protein